MPTIHTVDKKNEEKPNWLMYLLNRRLPNHKWFKRAVTNKYIEIKCWERTGENVGNAERIRQNNLKEIYVKRTSSSCKIVNLTKLCLWSEFFFTSYTLISGSNFSWTVEINKKLKSSLCH